MIIRKMLNSMKLNEQNQIKKLLSFSRLIKTSTFLLSKDMVQTLFIVTGRILFHRLGARDEVANLKYSCFLFGL